MAQVRPLKIQARERTGTGGARATRKAGLVPGVIYGGKSQPEAIAKIQTAMVIGAAFIEALTIYIFVLAFTLGNKL